MVTGMGNATSQYYWDRGTGALLEYLTLADEIPTTDTRLVESSMWGGGFDWMFWILVTVIIVIIVALILACFCVGEGT